MNQSTSLNHINQSIAFVEASWHEEIVSQSRHGFIDSLCARGIDATQIELFNVPGSLEIPLRCKQLAKSGKYSLIAAAGLIVDGGIYRHDFVASTVLDGMMQVQLQTEVPILSLVLTPHHFSAEQSHIDYFSRHFRIKGEEAADACLMMLSDCSKAA